MTYGNAHTMIIKLTDRQTDTASTTIISSMYLLGVSSHKLLIVTMSL